jgi:hypothetical protein
MGIDKKTISYLQIEKKQIGRPLSIIKLKENRLKHDYLSSIKKETNKETIC